MFEYIKIDDGIKYHKAEFTFKEGVTVITGPNGCGKSLLIEYLGFALFGVVSLRLSSDKYPNLSVEAGVRIKNNSYVISRTTKNCTLYNDKKEVICSGTKTCNTKIISLLGYNYNIYKMGNYAAQDEITQFGKLRPAERKKAVDQVLGLEVLDRLIKHSNEEASRLYSEAKGMGTILQEPIKPIMPQGYAKSSDIKTQMDAIKILIDKKVMLQEKLNWLSNIQEPIKPIPPHKLDMSKSQLDDCYKWLRGCRNKIERLESIPDPICSETDLPEVEKKAINWDILQEYKRKLSLIPQERSEITKQEALDGCTSWHNYRVYEGKRDVYNANLITCPKCKEIFNPGLSEKPEEVKEPGYSLEYYQNQLNLNSIWEGVTIPQLPEGVSEEQEEPQIKSYQIQNLKDDILRAKEKEQIPELLKSISQYSYLTDDVYNDLRKYYLQLEAYEEKLVEYQKKKNEYDNTVKELDSLKVMGEIETAYELLNDLYISSLSYENDLERYNQNLIEYQKQKETIDTYVEKGDKYKKASERVKELKITVKRFVLPSLEKVSSYLLYEMSEGLYRSIKIDDDFNIEVDGMEVATYSESEKAMINLALRFGLGQVLTHKAFSCFIGDEIDASMRNERAQATTDCLQKLSKIVEQIILISHRDIEAANYINLK